MKKVIENDDATFDTIPEVGIFESIGETIRDSAIVFESVQETANSSGSIFHSTELEEINMNKPWRQIIKRRVING